MAHKGPVLVVKVLVIIAIVVAGFGSAVLYLWNWLMPELFGLRTITFGQALGLMGLSWILFGGLRGFGHPHGARKWRRWRQMTPEERARFREGFRRRWCHGEQREDTPPYKDFA